MNDQQGNASAFGNATPQREMPRYQCHKIVHALKIERITRDEQAQHCVGPTAATITPADRGYADFRVSAHWMGKHQPAEGGYYVVYEDGYISYSPAAAFESGYTLIA